MDPDETRAVARLPHLDIELHHRASREEGVETLSITLRGRPDLDAAAAMLDPFRLFAAWAALNPWLAVWRPLQGRPRLPRPGSADAGLERG